MDISKKVLKFAENQKTINEKLSNSDFTNSYENGYDVGYSEGDTDGYNKGYVVGLVDGAASVPNLFEYATKLYDTFYTATFPDNYEVTIEVPNVTSMFRCFMQAKGIKKVTVKGNINGNVIEGSQAFRETSLNVIDLSNFIAKFGSIPYMFYESRQLLEIKGELDFTNATTTTTAFNGCLNLEEVRFKPLSILSSLSFVNSSKLSAESIQSIIDGLATVETQQKLILHGTTKKNLTEEQATQILNKNWVVM